MLVLFGYVLPTLDQTAKHNQLLCGSAHAYTRDVSIMFATFFVFLFCTTSFFFLFVLICYFVCKDKNILTNVT